MYRIAAATKKIDTKKTGASLYRCLIKSLLGFRAEQNPHQKQITQISYLSNLQLSKFISLILFESSEEPSENY